jgi:hypothetical protein
VWQKIKRRGNKMTAPGTLYVDENCRDIFEDKLNKWYGKDSWHLDGGPWGDIWDMAQMPKFIEVEVKDDDDKVIGKVSITNNHYIEDYGAGKFIECEPKSIKRIK